MQVISPANRGRWRIASSRQATGFRWPSWIGACRTQFRFGILPRGGTILKSSRTNPFTIENGVERIKENLAANGVEALIAIASQAYSKGLPREACVAMARMAFPLANPALLEVAIPMPSLAPVPAPTAPGGGGGFGGPPGGAPGGPPGGVG